MAAETTISGRTGPASSGSGSGVGSGATAATTSGSGVGMGSSPFSSLTAPAAPGERVLLLVGGRPGRLVVEAAALLLADQRAGHGAPFPLLAGGGLDDGRAVELLLAGPLDGLLGAHLGHRGAVPVDGDARSAWTAQPQAARMAAQATAQTFCDLHVGGHDERHHGAGADRRAPSRPGRRGTSARVQSSRPTDAARARSWRCPRPERKRWARVATEAVRTT